jgi:hypothetical protein
MLRREFSTVGALNRPCLIAQRQILFLSVV